MNKASIFIFLIFLSVSVKVHGQNNVLANYQDTLSNIYAELNATKDDEVKIAVNAEFVKTLVNALKIPYSYNFPFDSLRNVSFVKAPDNAFRIITWYLPMHDGSFRFYGAIQMSSPDGKLRLHPLLDGTADIKDNNEITFDKNWYGARYYDVIPVPVNGKQPYYILLGWKGVSSKVSSKVIEILSFDKSLPVFGKAVFDGTKSATPRNRIVMEYNKLNSMTLQRDHTVNLIVLDHLAPIDPSKKGEVEFYASDSSFDAYKILNGRLKLLENVELKNPPSEMDEFYNDPKLLKKAASNN